MKRLLFLPLLLAASAHAAGTCVESGTNPTYIYTTANNAVASATFYLKFYLVP
jgi:hypothetical protein